MPIVDSVHVALLKESLVCLFHIFSKRFLIVIFLSTTASLTAESFFGTSIIFFIFDLGLAFVFALVLAGSVPGMGG